VKKWTERKESSSPAEKHYEDLELWVLIID